MKFYLEIFKLLDQEEKSQYWKLVHKGTYHVGELIYMPEQDKINLDAFETRMRLKYQS